MDMRLLTSGEETVKEGTTRSLSTGSWNGHASHFPDTACATFDHVTALE
jgi:hypothetical protein